ERETIMERDHRAMALIDNAWTTFDLAKLADVTFVWSNAVAVRFERVRCLGQRVTHRRIHLPVATIAELRLQTIVVRDTQVHDHIDLSHAAVDRQDWSRQVR